MPLADKVTTETCAFYVPFFCAFYSEEKIITISICILSTSYRQYFDHLSFNSTLQLINDISSDLQKLLKYVNGTTVAAFLIIPFAPFAAVFSNSLALYSKNLKLLSLAISALKLVALSF